MGSFDNNDENVGSGMAGAPACGDVMKLQIKLMMKVSLKTCVLKLTAAVAIVSSSLSTEWVKGSLDEAQAIKNTDIAEEIELPPVKFTVLFWQKTRSKPPSRTIKANVKQNKS
ncbi:iron-sulfur cluster assembly scaffold protein [Shigella flexneri]